MIDFNKARIAFKNYVAHYDPSQDLIRLKIVHTYAVMDLTKRLCDALHVTEKQTSLAMLIGLLHDIGRFEQYVRYGTFVDYESIDHAKLGCDILFQEGLIRQFVQEDDCDQIIYDAIYEHNKFKVKEGYDEETLFYINMIRDTDKLDNFRVKETEKVETLLRCEMKDLVLEDITPKVYDDFMAHKLIYGPDRQSHLDMWISLAAFIYDFNFPESRDYIRKQDYINRSFDRIHPQREEVKKRYETLRQEANRFLAS